MDAKFGGNPSETSRIVDSLASDLLMVAKATDESYLIKAGDDKTEGVVIVTTDLELAEKIEKYCRKLLEEDRDVSHAALYDGDGNLVVSKGLGD